MSRAFAPESLAHCAAKGHRWRYVRAWHAVGWQECYCCGQTLAGLSDLVPVVIEPPAPACEAGPAESVAPPSPPEPESEAPRYADATPATPKKPRPPRAPVGTRPHGGQNRKAERDQQVLSMLAAGKPGKEIAAHFGLTESRISQIKTRAAAQGAV